MTDNQSLSNPVGADRRVTGVDDYHKTSSTRIVESDRLINLYDAGVNTVPAGDCNSALNVVFFPCVNKVFLYRH